MTQYLTSGQIFLHPPPPASGPFVQSSQRLRVGAISALSVRDPSLQKQRGRAIFGRGNHLFFLDILLSSSKISSEHVKRPKLAKLELRILEALWAKGSASMRDIQQAFPEPRPAYTTITNTIYRMEAKKAVRRVRKVGNADIFEPLIAKDAARESLLDEILSFFGGRAQPMIAQLIESGKITFEDIREMEKAAEEVAKQRKAERMRRPK